VRVLRVRLQDLLILHECRNLLAPDLLVGLIDVALLVCLWWRQSWGRYVGHLLDGPLGVVPELVLSSDALCYLSSCCCEVVGRLLWLGHVIDMVLQFLAPAFKLLGRDLLLVRSVVESVGSSSSSFSGGRCRCQGSHRGRGTARRGGSHGRC